MKNRIEALVFYLILFAIMIIGALIMMHNPLNGLIFVIVFGKSVDVFCMLIIRWRSDRLVQSLSPNESLVARGLVHDPWFDCPAILVRGFQKSYIIHITGARGSQVVRFVSPIIRWKEHRGMGTALTSERSKSGGYTGYLEFHTDQGLIHFAPVNRFFVYTKQPNYAQEILDVVLSDRVPVSGKASAGHRHKHHRQ